MIFLDTSVLVDGFGQNDRVTTDLRETLAEGYVVRLPSLVLFEWLRGPRRPEELALQAALFPAEKSAPFGPEEAAVGAEIYRRVPRARGREMDIAIAACAIARDAELWTLNRVDYRDIPGLQLYERP